jgi:hypothetical protein
VLLEPVSVIVVVAEKLEDTVVVLLPLFSTIVTWITGESTCWFPLLTCIEFGFNFSL